MKTEHKLFNRLALFMLPLAVVYYVVSREETGIVFMVVPVAFGFVGLYLWWQSRRMNGLRPEDYDATPEDGAGEVGSFPVGSIWPACGALGATVAALGLVFNGFLIVPGVIALLSAVIGMARETSQAEIGHVDLDTHANPGAPDPQTSFTDQVKK